MTTERIPPFFISHGSPALYSEKDTESFKFLRELGKKIKKLQPKAIVCVSAHWENSVVHVNTSPNPKQIYDFYGFPEEMYNFKYPAKGETQVAQRVVELLQKSGIQYKENESHGLDHGSWSPLSIIFPEADIPIVQVSLNKNLDAVTHFEIGKALSQLQYEGVWLVGSGSTVHNLSALRFSGGDKPLDWAFKFDSDLSKLVCESEGEERKNKAVEMHKNDKNLVMAHPRAEHLMPVWVSCGFGYNVKGTVEHSSMMYSSLAMTCYSF